MRRLDKNLEPIATTIGPLLNIEEAAAILRRSHWALRRDIKKGKICCLRMGRRILIEPAECQRLIEEARRLSERGSSL
jgi:hypothetical protein